MNKAGYTAISRESWSPLISSASCKGVRRTDKVVYRVADSRLKTEVEERNGKCDVACNHCCY